MSWVVALGISASAIRAAGFRHHALPNLRYSVRLRQSIPAPQETIHARIRHNSSQPPRPPLPPQSKQDPTAAEPKTAPAGSGESGESGDKTYGEKLKDAAKTPTKWYPIPIALGALVLLAVQFRKQTQGGSGSEVEVTSQGPGGAVVRGRTADGPWQVRVLGALPLRSLSQLWGYLNGLVLPVWFRPFGFKLYAYIFGCDLSEVPLDLREYDSLGSFFYREIKDGVRPIADAPMVSPADGRVLHYGEIVGNRVEQVKGITYSLGALLGQEGEAVGEQSRIARHGSKVQVVDDENFATINDIPYSIDKLMGSGRETKEEKAERKRRWKYVPAWLGGGRAPESERRGSGSSGWKFWKKRKGEESGSDTASMSSVASDASTATGASESSTRSWKFWKSSTGSASTEAHISDTTSHHDDDEPITDPNTPEIDASHPLKKHDITHDASVALSLGSSALDRATERGSDLTLLHPENRLYFFVVYLAPGDYHRFHSPTSWVVERRRHFTGDLFSVSPYIANRLQNLFVLNERVALLGRWKYGFYSMVPVGATNVGSIRINFDENLRTNTRQLSHPAHTFTEAVYTSASKILQGQPLLSGEEIGGFRLGSTIVMVFEAPKNWTWTVQAGDKIKVGQELGRFVDENGNKTSKGNVGKEGKVETARQV